MSNQQVPRKPVPGLAALIACLFCLGATLFQIYIGFLYGGLPPEVILFGLLALIFGALWYTSRKQGMERNRQDAKDAETRQGD